MGGIVVVGSLNVDYVFTGDALPARGETLAGHAFATEFGGKGANQAVAAARLGGSVTFLGAVGADAAGRSALAALDAVGVAIDGVERVADKPTGAAGIFVASTGDNAIVVVPGANSAIDATTVQRWAPRIAAADCVLLQLEIPLAAVLAVARIAREHGVPSILDPAPAPGVLPPAVADSVDILTPNVSEAHSLLGRELPASDAAAALAKAARSHVLVTQGADGVVLARTDASVEHFPARRVVARNTVAAGDAFNGALAVALTEQQSLPAAIAFAQCAASIAVTRDGAQRSMPSRSEVSDALPPVAET